MLPSISSGENKTPMYHHRDFDFMIAPHTHTTLHRFAICPSPGHQHSFFDTIRAFIFLPATSSCFCCDYHYSFYVCVPPSSSLPRCILFFSIFALRHSFILTYLLTKSRTEATPAHSTPSGSAHGNPSTLPDTCVPPPTSPHLPS